MNEQETKIKLFKIEKRVAIIALIINFSFYFAFCYGFIWLYNWVFFQIANNTNEQGIFSIIQFIGNIILILMALYKCPELYRNTIQKSKDLAEVFKEDSV